MAYTTITAATIGIADGDTSPTLVDGTVRITPRFPSAATTDGFIATGPVIATVTGGAMPQTEIPAQDDATALVEFHLYDRDTGPVRMPNTEIPIEPNSTISLSDFLPAGVDPVSGNVISRGERGYGITDITATDGVVTVIWGDDETVQIPIPTAALATPASDGLMPAIDKELMDSTFLRSAAAEGYPHAFVDANGRVSELAVDESGSIPGWVLDRWEARRGWGTVPDPVDIAAPTEVWRRTLLVDEFKRRRGQVIGTAGKAAVALRFDHGLVKFRDQILPLLDKYDLPSVQAMNPRNLENTQNAGVAWDDCLDWWANYGVEFSNHTATHASAGEAGTVEGRENAYDEIVNGLHELSTALGDEFPIELFTPPGGVKVGEKVLFDGGKTAENFYGTLWGHLILQNHAAAHGYIGGQVRPLPANNDIGLTIVGMDSSNAATLNDWVDSAVDAQGAVQFMFHPDELGKSGIITIADVEAFFAHIAARRDAGELEVLSATGLLLADPETDRRHDFLATFNDLAGWSNTTGWSADTGGMWATTETGGVMTVQVATSPNFRHYRGGNRLLTYDVVAPEGAVVETTVLGSSGVIDRTRQHTIPAGTDPVTVRHHCALPLVASPTVHIKVGRVSGGPVTISRPKLLTV